MKRNTRPSYLPVPNGLEDIKIANPSGIAGLYFDKKNRERNEFLPHTIGEDFECSYGGCAKQPQSVCPECVSYICEEHLYRHPNCSEGR